MKLSLVRGGSSKFNWESQSSSSDDLSPSFESDSIIVISWMLNVSSSSLCFICFRRGFRLWTGKNVATSSSSLDLKRKIDNRSRTLFIAQLTCYHFCIRPSADFRHSGEKANGWWEWDSLTAFLYPSSGGGEQGEKNENEHKSKINQKFYRIGHNRQTMSSSDGERCGELNICQNFLLIFPALKSLQRNISPVA